MPDNYDTLTRDQLISVLRKRDHQRRLGLVWERDIIEHEQALTDEVPLVALDQALSHGTGPWENLLIEGDNFHALRFLGTAYKGQVKCIYIDPPYNTGNKDFIYNDRFVNKEDGWRMSKWMEFLYRRLTLARDLLRSDGVLLVSINDENRAYLELLLEQIWPGGRKGSLVWRNRQGSNADQDCFLSVDHEHVLVWGNDEFRFQGFIKSYEMYANPDNDPNGPWQSDNLTLGFNYLERPNLYYPIYNPKTGIWHPANPNSIWRYATEAKIKPGQKLQAESMEEFIRRGQILFPAEQEVRSFNSKSELIAAIESGDVPKVGKNPIFWLEMPDLDFWIGKKIGFGRPRFKRYKKDLKNENQPLSSWVVPTFEEGTYETEVTIVSGTNQEGAKELQKLLGSKVFNYTKPISLMRSLIEQSTSPEDLVLDFFAGSGTTGQAAGELGRKFILVSSTEASEEEPDKNLCRDVASRRLKALNLPFAYLRMELAPRESLGRDLGVNTLWSSLQVLNSSSVSPLQDSETVLSLETGDQILILLKTVDKVILAELEARIIPTGKTGVVYTYQPGPVRQALSSRSDIRVESLPNALWEPLVGGRI